MHSGLARANGRKLSVYSTKVPFRPIHRSITDHKPACQWSLGGIGPCSSSSCQWLLGSLIQGWLRLTSRSTSEPGGKLKGRTHIAAGWASCLHVCWQWANH